MTDLYEELNAIDLGSEIESLQKRNLQLEKHIKCLEEDIETLCKTITEMKQTQVNLSTNISELFKTAKAEIDRKDRIIAELQTELDDLKFRRKRNNDRKRSRERNPNDFDIIEAKKPKIEQKLNVNHDAFARIIDVSQNIDNRDLQRDFKRSKSRDFKDILMQNDVQRKRSDSESHSYHNGRSRSRELKDRLQNDRFKRSRSRTKSPRRNQFDRNRQFSQRRQRSTSSHRNYRDRCHNDPGNDRFNRLHENKQNTYYSNPRQTSSYDRAKSRDKTDQNRDRNIDRTEKRENRFDKDKLKPDRNKFDNENKSVDHKKDDKSQIDCNNKLIRNNSEKDKKHATEKHCNKNRRDSKHQERCESESEGKAKSNNLKAKQVELFGFESSDTLLNSPKKDDDKIPKINLQNSEEISTNEDTSDMEMLKMKYEILQREIKAIEDNEKYIISNDISRYKIPKKFDSDGDIDKKTDIVDKKTRKPSVSEESKSDAKKLKDKTKNEKHAINKETESSKKSKLPQRKKSVDEKLRSRKNSKEDTKKIESSEIKLDTSKSEKEKPKKISLKQYTNKNLKIKIHNLQSKPLNNNKKLENPVSDDANLLKDEISKLNKNSLKKSLDMISLSSPVKTKNIKNENASKNIEIPISDDINQSKMNSTESNKSNPTKKGTSLDMISLFSHTNTQSIATPTSTELNQTQQNATVEKAKNGPPNKSISKKKSKSLDMISLSPTKTQNTKNEIVTPTCDDNNPLKEVSKKAAPTKNITSRKKGKSLDRVTLPSSTKTKLQKGNSVHSIMNIHEELTRSPLKIDSYPIEIVDSPEEQLHNFENALNEEVTKAFVKNSGTSYDVTHDGEIPTLHLDDQHYIPVVSNFDSTRDQCNFMKLLDGGETKHDENNKEMEPIQSLNESKSPGRLTFTNCLSKITSTPKLDEIVVSAPQVIKKTETSPVQSCADSVASDTSSKKENMSATPTKVYNLKRGRVVLSFRN